MATGDYPRKIYIDSRFRKNHAADAFVADTSESSDFVFELARTINLPKKCAAFIADVSVPHSWYNIDQHNRRLFFVEQQYQIVNGPRWPPGIVEFEEKNYTGTSLALAIEQGLTDATNITGRTYTCTYDSARGTLCIECTATDREFDFTGTYSATGVGPDKVLSRRDGQDSLSNVWLFADGTVAMEGIMATTLQRHDGVWGSYDIANDWISWPSVSETWTPIAATRALGYPKELFRQVDGFRLYSDSQLASRGVWQHFNDSTFPTNGGTTAPYDQHAPKSINEILRLHDLDASYFNVNNPYESSVIDLSGNNSPLYIASPDICRFNSSQGPRGEHTILRRIGATEAFGELIRDNLTTDLDYFIVASDTLKTLRFQLLDGQGNVMPMHGAEWSFSIIFQPLD